MLVAIEARKGLVVDRLLAAGFGVVPIHPNAARPRWGASRSTSDPGDSWKLADYVRTDGHRLARLGVIDSATADLQALCRLRDDLVEAKVAAMNHLDATLATHWRGARPVFFRLDSAIALSFLERYSTPASASKLGVGRMRQICDRVGYTGAQVRRRTATPDAFSAHTGKPVVIRDCRGAGRRCRLGADPSVDRTV